MIARTWSACVVWTVVFGGSHAHAQVELLAEADVVRLVHQSDPSVVSARARVASAEAAAVGVGRYPNPSLLWAREHAPGAGVSEDTIALTVPIALSGARAARSTLARAARASAEADAHVARTEATARAVGLFYEALASVERAWVLGASVERLRAGVEVLDRRHEEGTASGYERSRLAIELALAESEWREATLHAEALAARLAALLGMPDVTLSLQGMVDPGATERDATVSRESIILDAEAARLATAAGHDARSAWIPTLQLQGGVRIANAATTEVGYVAGIGFELPFSSPAAGLRAQAVARASAAEARAAERTRAWDVAAREARMRRVRTHSEVEMLDASTKELLDGLDRATTSGYREGHRSLVELLDAQRVRARVALRRIELSLSARRAEVALRAANGAFE